MSKIILVAMFMALACHAQIFRLNLGQPQNCATDVSPQLAYVHQVIAPTYVPTQQPTTRGKIQFTQFANAVIIKCQFLNPFPLSHPSFLNLADRLHLLLRQFSQFLFLLQLLNILLNATNKRVPVDRNRIAKQIPMMMITKVKSATIATKMRRTANAALVHARIARSLRKTTR